MSHTILNHSSKVQYVWIFQKSNLCTVIKLKLFIDVLFFNRKLHKRKIVHGTLTYKRKNIQSEAKRMRLELDSIRPKHIVFDDDGNAIESTNKYDDEYNFRKIGLKKKKKKKQPSSEDGLTDSQGNEMDCSGDMKSGHLNGKSRHIFFSDSDESDRSNSDSEPEELPIKHKEMSIARTQSCGDLSLVAPPTPVVKHAHSCEDRLMLLAKKRKLKFGRQLLDVSSLYAHFIRFL